MDEFMFSDIVKQIQLTEEQKQKLIMNCRGVKTRKKSMMWVGSACAALLAVCLTVFAIGGQKESLVAQDSAVAGGEKYSENYSFDDELEMMVPEVAVEDSIVVNEVPELMIADYSRINYSLEDYQIYMKNREQVEQYYDRSLELTGLPEDMVLMPVSDWKWEFILKRDTGAFVHDSVGIEYWNDWQDIENGGAKRMVWEGGRGFTVVMSQVGNFRCGILVPNEEMKTSRIDGVEILIGHRIMGTLYNENHEPGYEYDVYQAQFTHGGVEYEVITESMTLQELVQIVKSVISD